MQEGPLIIIPLYKQHPCNKLGEYNDRFYQTTKKENY